MTNLGQILLSIPLALSLLQAIKFFLKSGELKNKIHLNHKTLTTLTFASVVISFLFLMSRFVFSDFSYKIVFENSHTLKPLLYKYTGVWANHEGSMLLFILILSAYSFAFSIFSKINNASFNVLSLDGRGQISLTNEGSLRNLGEGEKQKLPLTPTLSRKGRGNFRDEVLGYQSAILFLILAYTYFTSNPFDPLGLEYMGATEGMGLNPLLQDIGLVIHPPMLYIGYAGFSIAFSIALVVLKNKITEKSWADYARPWVLFSWTILSIGVMLGSWWAYRELGWGGFWFWDPVENISLLPWLFSCAQIHLIYCTKKFNRFGLLSLLLCLITFLSSLMGFFLVRSGVLSSVHTFASDPTRGTFMLAIIFIIASYSMILFGKRMTEMKFIPEDRMSFLSREIFILFQVILLLAMAVTIILGIFYPLMLEIFFQKRISVGEPYFNAVFIPISLLLILIMVFAPILKWQKEKGVIIIKKSLFSFILSAAIVVYLKMNFEQVSNFLGFAIFCCLWLSISTPELIIRKLIKKDKVSKGYTAMTISHMAFGMIALSVALIVTFETDSQVVLKQGEQKAVGDYNIKIEKSEIIKGKNYLAQKAYIILSRNGDEIAALSPENRIYFPDLTKTHEADIDYGILKDIYVVMGQTEESGQSPESRGQKVKDKKEKAEGKELLFPTRIYIKPFIFFVWFSVLLMAFGGFLAMLPKRK